MTVATASMRRATHSEFSNKPVRQTEVSNVNVDQALQIAVDWLFAFAPDGSPAVSAMVQTINKTASELGIPPVIQVIRQTHNDKVGNTKQITQYRVSLISKAVRRKMNKLLTKMARAVDGGTKSLNRHLLEKLSEIVEAGGVVVDEKAAQAVEQMKRTNQQLISDLADLADENSELKKSLSKIKNPAQIPTPSCNGVVHSASPCPSTDSIKDIVARYNKTTRREKVPA